MSTKATVPYIDILDREGQTEDGKPVKGATTFKFRPLKSSEEGVLMDSMFDLGNSAITPSKDGGDAKVDMAMKISPSQNRRNRVQMALSGWEGLYGPENDKDGKAVPLEYVETDINIGGQIFKGAAADVMDMLNGPVLTRMEKFVRSLSRVETGSGNV
jgi:hypothetical protein